MEDHIVKSGCGESWSSKTKRLDYKNTFVFICEVFGYLHRGLRGLQANAAGSGLLFSNRFMLFFVRLYVCNLALNKSFLLSVICKKTLCVCVCVDIIADYVYAASQSSRSFLWPCLLRTTITEQVWWLTTPAISHLQYSPRCFNPLFTHCLKWP